MQGEQMHGCCCWGCGCTRLTVLLKCTEEGSREGELCVRYTGRTGGQEQHRGGGCGVRGGRDRGGGARLYKLPFTTRSLHGLVAVVWLTDKPFRRDSSVGVLPACRAALLNHCHSRHVVSDSTRPRLNNCSGFVIRKRSFGPVGAHARVTVMFKLHARTRTVDRLCSHAQQRRATKTIS